MLNLGNFVRTTLRTPAAPGDTQLALALGSSSAFNIPAGDYFYITVEDGSTVEVMKYTSGGVVVNDLIPVERGQDGTTPKAFPTGACVKLAWNKQQIIDLITQVYVDLFNSSSLPEDTMLTSGVPTAAPPGNVIFAVDPDTHRLWYWDLNLPAWLELGAIGYGISTTAGVPTLAPTGSVRLNINLTASTLYWWNGTAWVLLTGASGTVEVWNRMAQNGNASMITLIASSTQAIGPLIVGGPLDQIRWRSNPALASILSQDGSGRFTFSHNALVRVSYNIEGAVASPGTACSGVVVITTDEAVNGVDLQWTEKITVPTGASEPNFSGIVASNPFKISSGKVVDGTIVIDSSSGTVDLTAIQATVEVLALL